MTNHERCFVRSINLGIIPSQAVYVSQLHDVGYIIGSSRIMCINIALKELFRMSQFDQMPVVRLQRYNKRQRQMINIQTNNGYNTNVHNKYLL